MLYAALLGIVQGLTEFLPVSSSAHLILARAFLGWDAEQFGLAFDVACHVGTLLAVVAYFKRDLLAMVTGLARAFEPEDPTGRSIRLIVVGTVPIVLAGLTANDFIENTLRTPPVAAVALGLGALVMLAAEGVGRRSRGEESMTLGEALAVGLAQASALIPGVSRSGATITVAMFLGLRRDAAARFSFLLGVPAILAAAAKEALELRHQPLTGETAQLFAIGMLTSAIVGYLTVKYFIQYLAGHRLNAFAFYRFALAATVPAWLALT
jgi:undecaprenyl-diphosphatase